MKCTIPEISWHNRDPVLSVDIQPILNNDFYRLATAGTDSHVLIWHLRVLETGACSTDPVCDLTRHQRAVNVVRWSPNGQYLASGDDDANIIIWQHKPDSFCEILDGETQDKEKWSVFKILRGHKEDIYDISWSPNNLKLISGSVDNTAIIWDLNKGNNDNILTDHKGFVQGVCWDPKSDFLATLSSDRTCRIFNETGKNVKYRISKGTLNLPENHVLHGQVVRYYHDDTLKSFFRRLSFSPDGNLLITPAGCLEIGENKLLYTTYIYSINNLSQPAAILPSPNQYTIVVKCCPVLFELRPEGPEPAIQLPYRIVIAVATRSSVILYDTQQLNPFAVISNIHYTRLTDLTWSANGQILVVSSTDGFCSLVTFEPNELGAEYVKNEESDIENMEIVEEKIVKSTNEVQKSPEESKKVVEEKKRPSFLMQWAKASENKSEIDKKSTVMKEKDTSIIVIEDSPEKEGQQVQNSPLPTSNVARNLQNSLSTAAKPIEVRRKPREPNSNPITKEVQQIEVQKTPKSLITKPVQVQNNHKNDSNTQAKPIAVRKRPRNDPSDSQTFKNQPTPIEVRKKPKPDTSNSTQKEAKPIAVRRKQQNESESPQIKPEVQKVQKPKLPLDSNKEAKPIAVRRKPKETTSTDGNKTKSIENSNEVQKSPKSKIDSETKIDVSEPVEGKGNEKMGLDEPKVPEVQKSLKSKMDSDTKIQNSDPQKGQLSEKKDLNEPEVVEVQKSSKSKMDSNTKIDNSENLVGKLGEKVDFSDQMDLNDAKDVEVQKLEAENTPSGKGSARKSKTRASMSKVKIKLATPEVQSSPKSLSKKKLNLNSPSVSSPSNSGSKKKWQMDITKFLTSGPSETKSRVSLFPEKKKVDSGSSKSEKMDSDCILIEDDSTDHKDLNELVTIKQSPRTKLESPKKCDNSTQDMRLFIEESQDFKLVLEDDPVESPSSPKKIESPNCSEQNLTEKNSENQKSINDLKNKIFEIHLQSPVQKKKVPFITLSSPKNKKNKS